MKRAIYTCCYSQYDSYYEQLSDITFDSMKRYSKRIGVDFYCNREYLINSVGGNNDLNAVKKMMDMKLKIFDILENYDQVLYIDSDIYITSWAENIFLHHNDPEYSYFFNQGCGSQVRQNMKKVMNEHNDNLIRNNISPLCEKKLISDKTCYNAGLFILSNKYKDIFLNEPRTYVPNVYYEQEWFNWLILRNDLPIKNINETFNKIVFNSSPLNFFKNNNFLHFGSNPKDKYETLVKLLATSVIH